MAMDSIREKHGRQAIRPGSVIEPEETVLLPDEKDSEN